MLSIIFVCALISRSFVGANPVEMKVSNFSGLVSASGKISSNDLEASTGSIQVIETPFIVSVSRSSDKILSAHLGYSSNFSVNVQSDSTFSGDIDADAEISSQAVTVALSAKSSSIYGNPTSSMHVTASEDGVTDYGLVFNVESASDNVQVDVKLSEGLDKSVNFESTVEFGPIAGVVTKNASGWAEKLVARLNISTSPEIILIGEIHRDTSNEMHFVLGFESNASWAKVQINHDQSVDFHLGATFSGQQNDTNYYFRTNLDYSGGNKTAQYDAEATVGPVTAIMNGTAYEKYNLQLQLNLGIVRLTMNVDADGSPSFICQLDVNDSELSLFLDENFKPSELTGSFSSNLLSLWAQTDLNGEYQISFDFNGNVVVLAP